MKKTLNIGTDKAKKLIELTKNIIEYSDIGTHFSELCRVEREQLMLELSIKHNVHMDDYYICPDGVCLPKAHLLTDRELLETIYENLTIKEILAKYAS